MSARWIWYDTTPGTHRAVCALATCGLILEARLGGRWAPFVLRDGGARSDACTVADDLVAARRFLAARAGVPEESVPPIPNPA